MLGSFRRCDGVGDSKITVGDVEISHLYDLVADWPITLDQVFPKVPDQAWEPYRRECPSLFGPGNVPRFHVGCYLIRSRGRPILAGRRGSLKPRYGNLSLARLPLAGP